MIKKFVIWDDWGGYGEATPAMNTLYFKLTGEPLKKDTGSWGSDDYMAPNDREDPAWCQVIEELGKETKYKVVYYNDDFVEYYIDNYDGWESAIFYPKLEALANKSVEELKKIFNENNLEYVNKEK